MVIRQQRMTLSRHSSFLSQWKIGYARFSRKVFYLSKLQSGQDCSSVFLMSKNQTSLQGFRRRFSKNSACIPLKSNQKRLGYADQIKESSSLTKLSSMTLSFPNLHLPKSKKLRKSKMRTMFKTLRNYSKKVSTTVARTWATNVMGIRTSRSKKNSQIREWLLTNLSNFSGLTRWPRKNFRSIIKHDQLLHINYLLIFIHSHQHQTSSFMILITPILSCLDALITVLRCLLHLRNPSKYNFIIHDLNISLKWIKSTSWKIVKLGNYTNLKSYQS